MTMDKFQPRYKKKTVNQNTVESKLKPGLDGFIGGTGISEVPCAKCSVSISDLYIRLWPLLSGLA